MKDTSRQDRHVVFLCFDKGRRERDSEKPCKSGAGRKDRNKKQEARGSHIDWGRFSRSSYSAIKGERRTSRNSLEALRDDRQRMQERAKETLLN